MRKDAACPHCGCVLDADSRTRAEHNLFFAIIDAAFSQWREEHTFLPDNSRHLRAYLLNEAGWRDSEFIEHSDDPKANERLADILETQFRRERKKGVYIFIKMAAGGVHVHRPRSINASDVKRKEFRPIASKVYEIIEFVIGVPAERLVREHEAAA